jgi:hypothetical protein
LISDHGWTNDSQEQLPRHGGNMELLVFNLCTK